MKKIMNLLLSIMMIFSLCMTVSAEGEDNGTDSNSTDSSTSAVTSIDLSIKPILGSKVVGPFSYKTYAYATTHIKVDSFEPSNAENGLAIANADWYKIADKDYTGDVEKDKEILKRGYIRDENEVFQDGYHYYVTAYIVDMGPEYDEYLSFKDVTGTINGNEAKTNVLDPEYDDATLCISGYVDVLGIYNIDMTVTEPALGKTADYKPVITKISDDVNDKTYGPWATVESTTWHKVAKEDYKGLDDSDWVEMEEDEEFTTGYYYDVDFCILEDNNPEYDYLYRTISKNLTGTINGESFDAIGVFEDQYSALLTKIYEPLYKSITSVDDIEDQTYTGKAIEPKVVVKDGTTVLVEGKDYSVEYKNNVNVSTDKESATVVITGIGDYAGTINKNFKINDVKKESSSNKVVTCEEAMNSKNWTWSESKKACVYKVTNTSSK